MQTNELNELADFSGQSIDNYQVGELLTRRKFSSLYLAYEDGADTPVFLEILNATSGDDADLDGRFRRQLRALAPLKHSCIAPVLTIGRTPDNHSYAAIQHVAGVSLAQKTAEWRQAGSSLTVQEALTLVRHLADALAVVHPSGIVHHDLRPENIFLCEDNAPVLIDLGVPFVASANPVETTDSQPMTLDYASPEQRQGKMGNNRSNIYSLGVILYELLADHPPRLPISSWDIFERATLPKEVPLEQARPGLSEETYELVRTCLWRQEWSRFETAHTLVKALDTAMSAEERQAQLPETSSRWPRWLYMAAPIALVIIALIAFLLIRQGVVGSPPSSETAVPTPNSTSETQLIISTATTGASPSPTTAITEAPPSPTDEPAILLLAPTQGFEFAREDTIIFDWYWPVALESDQQFSLHVMAGGEPQLIGTVSRPISGSQYRISVEAGSLGLETGAHEWFIALEAAETGEVLLSSERYAFFLQAGAPTATHTPTATPRQTTTATQTRSTSCVVSPPPGWVEYTVQQGDFLFNLALATGATVAQIQEVNCLADPAIGAGKRLWLPILPATRTPTPPPTSVVPTAKPAPTKPAATKTPPPPP